MKGKQRGQGSGKGLFFRLHDGRISGVQAAA